MLWKSILYCEESPMLQAVCVPHHCHPVLQLSCLRYSNDILFFKEFESLESSLCFGFPTSLQH